ncbi:DUF6541 family protein [Arthrobacter cryoconiti]|uniref:DUF6541 family protein n=1 Tax=Arthrobacter cryoconiti TaxID=748907 RepID=A0ABV8QWX5_9MICC|nr:DUF6541 family protein [Arthrobacter cryoconiti]MCC9069025.1 hypothetical protein [Arthrobacter cryoconiti]
MLSSWAAAVPAILVAILIFFGPGFLLVRLAGGRTALALGLAPLVGTSIVSVAAESLRIVGAPWNLWAFVPVALACCLGTWLLRRLLRGSGSSVRPESERNLTRNILVSIGIAAALLAPRLLLIFGSAGNISQTTDDVFHLNTIRLMLDVGNGSIFTPALLNGDGPGGFYPAAWHSIVSLVAGTTGVGIPASVNSVNLVIGALVWPAGAIFLARQIFGNRALTMFAVSVLTVCFAAFPFRLLDWGVLYPNFFAMALTMPLWGLALLLLKQTASGDEVSVPMTWWLVLTAAPAAILAHPNALLAVIALVIPLIVARLWGLWNTNGKASASSKLRFRLSALYIGLLVIGVTAWISLRPIPLSNINTNPPYTTIARAFGEWLTGTNSGHLAAVGTLPLVVLGVVHLVRTRSNLWLLGSYGAVSLLFIAVTGFPLSTLRTFLTGGWYDDYNRVIGLVVLVALPLAALGATCAVDYLRGALVTRWPATTALRSLAISLTLVLGGSLLISQVVTVNPAAASAQSRFNIAPGAPMMSADEYRLFKRLDDLVPADAAIAGNPWNGSAMAYWVSGRHLIFSHIFVPMTPDRKLVARSLRRASFDARVCAAAKRLNIQYVLGSSEPEFAYGKPDDGSYSGMNNMDSAVGFNVVAQEGTATLYKMANCG